MTVLKFNEPYLTNKELEYISDVFSEKKFYGAGKYTNLCEEKIASVIGAENALLTDSCTAALEIVALLLRDFTKKQEVIVPSYTFTSSASAFARAGFDIVFCEVNETDLMIDADDVRAKICEHTVAIIPVHYGGLCADITKICELGREFNVFVVEDGAQAFGAFLNDRHLGTFGDFGCFSFHETKNIHCGLGGALVINNEDFAKRARHIWERGTNRQEVLKGLIDKYSWVEIGGSFYPSELQAAFLFAQLESLDTNLTERKLIYDVYRNGLVGLRHDKKIWFPDMQNDYRSNYHAFYIMFDNEIETDSIRKFLVSKEVQAFIGYVPLHSSPVGLKMGYSADSLPRTERLSKCILRLPLHNNMSPETAQSVSLLITEYFDVD
jgi:dTDP-4-amino-4,6-dideoxygalactose transaminase